MRQGVIGRVAVVEDAPEIRALLRDVLGTAGHTVEMCWPGPSLLVKLQRFQPDLIIADLQMERREADVAMRLIRTVRETPGLSEASLLALSADLRVFRDNDDELRRIPYTECLGKPFSLDDFENAVFRGVVPAVARRLPVASAEHAILLSRDGVVIADPGARYRSANHHALQMLGYSVSELQKLSIDDLVVRGQDWALAAWTELQSQGWWRGPVELRRADGSILNVEAIGRVMATLRAKLTVAWWKPIPEGLVPAPAIRVN